MTSEVFEEFRTSAQQHIEWIASYLAEPRHHRVLPQVAPGDIKASLPEHGPEQGESLERIFEDFRSVIAPGLTLWNHPRFFAWFAISSPPPAILAEMLAATVNVNAMLWKSSPAATELEEVTLGWLREWLGLDEHTFGIIYDTASVSVMHALGAARERVAPECRTEGMRPGMTVYVSEQTHSCAEKAAITLGFGQNNVRRIGVDDEFRMVPELLEEAIAADVADGKRPCAIVATIGTTATTSIDPVPAIAQIAKKYDAWLHIDAAYGGSAAILPEMRHFFAGVEQADSVIVNPHKWFFVPVDLSVLYTRHQGLLRQAFALSSEVLKTKEDSEVVNYMDYGIQLGRRFRALKLWYVMRYYGRDGISRMLRESLQFAQLLAQRIEENGAFELAAPVLFSLVCFRMRGSNDDNRQLLASINESGQAFLSHTVLQGRFTLRFAIGNFMTTAQDIEETWSLISSLAEPIRLSSKEAPDLETAPR